MAPPTPDWLSRNVQPRTSHPFPVDAPSCSAPPSIVAELPEKMQFNTRPAPPKQYTAPP
jgi:hypothetical protein